MITICICLLIGCAISYYFGYNMYKINFRGSDEQFKITSVGWRYIDMAHEPLTQNFGVMVVALLDNGEEIIVKEFRDDDMEYNILCARELIEKIKE